MSITLVGRLIRKQSFDDWAIGVFEESTGATHKVVGALVETLSEADTYELEVKEEMHAKHGLRLLVTAAVPYIGLEKESLVTHLIRNFNGVGPKTAHQIVHWYDLNSSYAELRRILAHEPWRLHGFVTAGTKKGIEFVYSASTGYSYLYTHLATRFGATGVADPVIRRIARWLSTAVGADCVDPIGDALKLFAQDPFKPVLSIWGYTFDAADTMARAMGGRSNDPVRLAGMAYHALKTVTGNEGHTYIPRDILNHAVLGIDFSIDPREAIKYALQLKYPMTIDANGRCYSDKLMHVEDDVASMLAVLMARSYPLRGFANESELNTEISQAEHVAGWGHPLDASQKSAVIAMLHANCRIHTLTAGPGFGKTSTMEVFCQVAKVRVMFCAPTGKAAKVLHERVSKYGYSASTIHQMLEPIGPDEFRRNEDYPLETQMVVVDEAGMLGLTLVHALLLALPPGAHLVLMGDRDQLMSIDPGNFLLDVLSLPADHQTLEQTHRNSGAILQLVQQVRKGEFYPPPTDFDSDVLYLPLGMKDASAFDFVEDVYLDALGRFGSKGVVMLVPNRKGKKDVSGWNTTYLNHRFQKRLNPHGARIAGTDLLVNDRIIIRRNMEVLDEAGDTLVLVVNGDTGVVTRTITSQEGQLQRLVLTLDDGRCVSLTRESIDLVDMAYVMTVHSAQGSEYPCVIVAIANGPSSFLNRSVFYTGISRSKRELKLFGSAAQLQGVARRTVSPRFSALTQKVQEVTGNA